MTIRIGDGSTPVLLIHASGSGARPMVPIAKSMIAADRSLQVSIPTLCGYDGTTGPAGPGAIDRHLAILEREIGRFTAPCFIVGHSMGGFLGLKLTASLTAPGSRTAILGVVAVEPMAFGLLSAASDQAARREDREVQSRMQALIDAGEPARGMACFIEYWNQTPWADIPAQVRDQIVALAPVIRSEVAEISVDTTSSYQISTPVHLMYGENSPLPAQRVVQRLTEKLEAASVEMISNAGHMSLLRNPEKYLPGILRLFERCSTARAPDRVDTLR